MRAASYRRLPTEQHNPASRDIDTLDSAGILRIIHREDARVPAAVAACTREIARAVEAAVACLRRGGRLFFVGAGTSGRLGVLEAAECPPTFGIPPGLVRALMAGGPSAVFRSKEGAEDDAREGGRRVRSLARRGDMVVGVAASGITPFVRGALAQARRLGCRTALVTSNASIPAPGAQIVISPRVGPEVLSGSTRLKSGTAAKLVLNALTTASMIRLGKAFGHWMVDLKPVSLKLRARAVRIVCDLGRVSPARARSLLGRARWDAQAAVLMARLGAGPEQARRRLEAGGGSLRKALEDSRTRRKAPTASVLPRGGR